MEVIRIEGRENRALLKDQSTNLIVVDCVSAKYLPPNKVFPGVSQTKRHFLLVPIITELFARQCLNMHFFVSRPYFIRH